MAPPTSVMTNSPTVTTVHSVAIEIGCFLKVSKPKVQRCVEFGEGSLSRSFSTPTHPPYLPTYLPTYLPRPLSKTWMLTKRHEKLWGKINFLLLIEEIQTLYIRAFTMLWNLAIKSKVLYFHTHYKYFHKKYLFLAYVNLQLSSSLLAFKIGYWNTLR